MVSAMAIKLKLNTADKAELRAKLRCRSLPAEDVRRADIILRLAEGEAPRSVARQMRCSITKVRLWRERFQVEGLSGLYGRHQGRPVEADSPALEARILQHTTRSQRRLDLLEHAHDGTGIGNQSHARGSHLSKSRAPTAPSAPLHGQ